MAIDYKSNLAPSQIKSQDAHQWSMPINTAGLSSANDRLLSACKGQSALLPVQDQQAEQTLAKEQSEPGTAQLQQQPTELGQASPPTASIPAGSLAALKQASPGEAALRRAGESELEELELAARAWEEAEKLQLKMELRCSGNVL